MLARQLASDNTNVKTQKSKCFLSSVPDLRFVFVELEVKLAEDVLQNGIRLGRVSCTEYDHIIRVADDMGFMLCCQLVSIPYPVKNVKVDVG